MQICPRSEGDQGQNSQRGSSCLASWTQATTSLFHITKQDLFQEPLCIYDQGPQDASIREQCSRRCRQGKNLAFSDLDRRPGGIGTHAQNPQHRSTTEGGWRYQQQHYGARTLHGNVEGESAPKDKGKQFVTFAYLHCNCSQIYLLITFVWHFFFHHFLARRLRQSHTIFPN